MRKIISIVLALMVVLMVSVLTADAGSGGRGGGHGGHGGYSSHGGGHGGGYVRHGGYYRHGGHGDGHVRIGVNFGPGWWGPYPYSPYYYPYYYPYPYSPYYPAVRVIQQPASDIYVEPSEEATRYLYYCPQPEGYYPAVEKCPKGWLKVVPPGNPPE